MTDIKKLNNLEIESPINRERLDSINSNSDNNTSSNNCKNSIEYH